ncbi:MAG: cysteine--tRNA ligase [Anaerolineales bacterium]|jgi:cysteinyl-tRNA synthetase
MSLTIYNTLSRKKEPFEPLEAGVVKMYVCGPTVYGKAHVGHGMSSIVFDIIRRYLEYRGYRVDHVMNYTDVDDKVIQRAQELGEDPLTLAERHLKEYDQHLKDLNVLPASVFPRVSTEIKFILEMVEGLIDNGHAYEVDGDVYFRVESDPDYGKLSGRKVEDMQAGARLEVDPRKENPADFALWKAAKAGEPSWESPWGRGRPGWHIECSAMSLHHLGEQIDIHGGGADLIFPHHENEIAQTEGLTGKPFARYWVHNGMMQLTGEKMSRSVGNIISIEAFLDEHPGDVLRMAVLNGSYRSPLVFNDDVIQQATSALERLKGGLRAEAVGEGDPASEAELTARVAAAQAGFKAAMDDDFNTAAAMSHVFDLVRAINQARDIGAGQESLAEAQAELKELTRVLGLRLEAESTPAEAGPYIELLLDIRQRLREQGEFELADSIRDGLTSLGVIIEDTKGGSTWRFQS